MIDYSEYEAVLRNRDFQLKNSIQTQAKLVRKEAEVVRLNDRIEAMMMILRESGRAEGDIQQEIEENIGKIEEERELSRW